MAIEGLFYIHLEVTDLDRAKVFYGETLGWTLNTNEPGVAGLWFGSAYLVASQAAGAVPGPRGAGVEVAVRVDDLDDQHRRLSDGGVAPSPIETKPWGERSFTFKDPDGYAWRYGALAVA